MYRRLLVAVFIGVVSGLLCYRYQITFNRGAGDMSWPLCGARALLAGADPYRCPHMMSNGSAAPTNPLTTVIFVLPFSSLPLEWAAACLFGLSSALLALGLTRDAQWWRLLVFLAFPYWAALQTVQWSPLLFAVALFPGLLPITLVKPHLGLPIVLTRLNRWRALACVVCGLSSLLIDPTWLLRWLAQIGSYGGFVPVLTPLGLLLLLAIMHWRHEQVRLFLLLSVIPQRLFYDQFLVWLLPQSRREISALVLCSWLGYFGFYLTGRAAETWVVATLFLPALLIVMRRSAVAERQAAAADPGTSPRVNLL